MCPYTRYTAQEWKHHTPNAHELIFPGIGSMVVVLMIPGEWVD